MSPDGDPPTDLGELRELLAAATDVRAIAAQELTEAEPVKRKGR